MIVEYEPTFRQQVVDLIMYVQNIEYGVGLTIDDQPDILDIPAHYIASGGNFWVALGPDREVLGCIGLQKNSETVAVLKKFFVYAKYRGQPHGYSQHLFATLLAFAQAAHLRTIILDTPAVAQRSHSFYRRKGFREISRAELPVPYEFPDRNSLLFLLDLMPVDSA